ncbi:hypothetical protein KBI23_13145 [bacterium]|nr:hypothetical protein [bacterium]MBP9810330.1 hypothetical protein [bacterium]
MSHLEQHEAVKSAEAGAAAAAQAGSRLFEDSYGSNLKPGGGGNSSGTGKGDASSAEVKPAGGGAGGASKDSCLEIKPLKQSN